MKLSPIAVLSVVALLAACGGKTMDGKFVGTAGFSLDFKPNGKVVYMDAVELPYKVEGQEIKLASPEKGDLIVKIIDDKTLQMPFIGTLKKADRT